MLVRDEINIQERSVNQKSSNTMSVMPDTRATLGSLISVSTAYFSNSPATAIIGNPPHTQTPLAYYVFYFVRVTRKSFVGEDTCLVKSYF